MNPLLSKLQAGMKNNLLVGKLPSASGSQKTDKSNPLLGANSGMGNALAGLLMGKVKDNIHKKMMNKVESSQSLSISLTSTESEKEEEDGTPKDPSSPDKQEDPKDNYEEIEGSFDGNED